MAETRSRFGANLFLQLVLASILMSVGSAMPPAVAQLFQITGTLMFWAFSIGLLYGFFRLLGIRGETLEYFYQHFPLGFSAYTEEQRGSDTAASRAHVTSTEAEKASSSSPLNKTEESKPFEWEDLLSVQYLRYAGLLLIISALFSYLFKIDWNLSHRIFAAFAGGCVCLAAAEFLRSSSRLGLASSLFILSFTLFQFTITLSCKYYWQSGENPGFWLFLKFILTLAALPLLSRYDRRNIAGLYVIVAYLSPLTILAVTGMMPFQPNLVFIVLMTLTILAFAIGSRLYSLISLNAVVCNINIFILFLNLPYRASTETYLYGLLLSLIVFLLHLGAGCHAHLSAGEQKDNLSTAGGILLLHVGSLTNILVFQSYLPSLQAWSGVTLLLLSLPDFAVYLALQGKAVSSTYRMQHFDLGLLLSAIGLYMQASDPWTAIAFLLYSCAMVYVSIVYSSRRSRIYAFVILSVSLFKLYTECGELFESISGTTAIFSIGFVLLLLSYKLENIKGIVRGEVVNK